MRTSVHFETVTTELRTQTSALFKDPKRLASARDKLRTLVVQPRVNLSRFYFHRVGFIDYSFSAKPVVLPWVASNLPLRETNCWVCWVWKPCIPKVF